MSVAQEISQRDRASLHCRLHQSRSIHMPALDSQSISLLHPFSSSLPVSYNHRLGCPSHSLATILRSDGGRHSLSPHIQCFPGGNFAPTNPYRILVSLPNASFLKSLTLALCLFKSVPITRRRSRRAKARYLKNMYEQIRKTVPCITPWSYR